MKLSIKNWPETDRPREKLIKHGAHLLTTTELLAILIQSGTKGESAIDIARKIVSKFSTLRDMSCIDVREWKEFKGLGKAKIAILLAAFEIACRYNITDIKQNRTKVAYTEDIVKLYQTRMRDLKKEVFKIIILDTKNSIIDTVEISEGSPTGVTPIIREIISKSLQKFASGLICIHNHPNGEPTPSNEDVIFTNNLKQILKSVEIRFLDHIIFAENKYYSFDKGTVQDY